jgi:CBS domain-containing protein/anti-sigma regulatory factor (Ser/Thr protein kinase)
VRSHGLAERATAIQELVYELRVGAVMSRDVITVSPETRMSDLRSILRDRRISGTPVMEGERIVGIVSVEDFINWLAQGGIDCPVAERMSTQVRTIVEDEPLVQAVSVFDRRGYGRLPVVERRTGRLVGVLTKGDIIEGLLRRLEVSHTEEELRSYRASHIFRDMVADQIAVRFRYGIHDGPIEQGGSVASGLKKSLRRLGLHPEIVRRAAIATYEAEMNVIIYAREGTVTVNVQPERVEIEVADRGPGIPDIARALEPGYTTAPDWVRELGFGAGMGLPNIQSCAGQLDIASTVGQGTTLRIMIPMEV